MEVLIFIAIVIFLSLFIKDKKEPKNTNIRKSYRNRDFTNKIKYPCTDDIEDLDIPDPYADSFSREKYINHLSSPRWSLLKQSKLLIDDFKCKQCGIPVEYSTSHCHHITYKRLGNELLEDLVTVCPDCHNKIHEFHGKNAGHYPLLKL